MRTQNDACPTLLRLGDRLLLCATPAGRCCTVGNGVRVRVEVVDDCADGQARDVCRACRLEYRPRGMCLNMEACLSRGRLDGKSVRFVSEE